MIFIWDMLAWPSISIWSAGPKLWEGGGWGKVIVGCVLFRPEFTPLWWACKTIHLAWYFLPSPKNTRHTYNQWSVGKATLLQIAYENERWPWMKAIRISSLMFCQECRCARLSWIMIAFKGKLLKGRVFKVQNTENTCSPFGTWLLGLSLI